MATNSMAPGRWIWAALLLLVVGLSPGLRAEDAGTPVVVTVTGAESAETIDKLFGAAVKQGRPVEFHIVTAPKDGAKKSPTALELDRSGWSLLLENLKIGIDYGWESLPFVTQLPHDLWQAFLGIRNGPGPASALLTALALVLGSAVVGYGVTGLVQRLRPVTRPDWHPQPPESLCARTLAGGALALANLLGLSTFLMLSEYGIEHLLPLPDLARWSAEAVRLSVTAFVVYSVAADVLLAPHHPQRRLLPLPRAAWHARNLKLYGLASPLVFEMADFFEKIGSSPLAVAGWFSLAASGMALFKLWWFWTGRHDVAELCRGGETPTFGHRVMAILLPPFLILSALLVWAAGRIASVAPDGGQWAHAVGITQILLILMPIMAGGTAALAEELVARRHRSEAENPILRAWGAAAATVTGALAWVFGLRFLSDLWQFFLLEIFSPAQVAALEGPIVVVGVLLIGWIVWTFLEALFTAYLPNTAVAIGPTADEEAQEHAVQSRFGTILPLLRAVILTGVVALTALSALSRLGLDIAPLLAGFGIVGLAISFGSQTLVRDIVSGIFFIADDAFRVGEYIDTGRLKGTVERITLRSVQLRHQSGLVHTIPFGQIASVTNSSRDWATVKFNIRLDRETDLEKTRKTIKRVGLTMLEDPELGPELILPLKLQGVAEIADSAIVVRLKFTSKPDRASWVQREALKRTYAALREAGVEFASNAVTVRGGDAASGAAASLATPPTPLPPL